MQHAERLTPGREGYESAFGVVFSIGYSVGPSMPKIILGAMLAFAQNGMISLLILQLC